jgi:hypothetical protein
MILRKGAEGSTPVEVRHVHFLDRFFLLAGSLLLFKI